MKRSYVYTGAVVIGILIGIIVTFMMENNSF